MSKNLKFIFLATLLVLIAFFVVILINSRTSVRDGSRLQISASFYPLYFFTSQIVGDKASVINITPAGAEPHDYELTTQDIVGIQKSKALVLNGGVEPWAEKIKANLTDSKVKIIVAGSGLTTQSMVEEGKSVVDPHIWLDPVLAKKQAEKIEKGLEDIDPSNATYFRSNLIVLEEKLDQLNMQYESGLSSCNKKDIITSHAAFGYLARQYGLNQVSVAGISPDEEPSAQALSEVSNFARKNKIKYIFFESLVSPKLSQTIATEIGAKTLVLDPLEGIADNDIKIGKNYFTVMQDNLKNLQIALECNK